MNDDAHHPHPHSLFARGAVALRWLGPLILVGLIAFVAFSTQTQDFLRLVGGIHPAWLLLALALQSETYFAHAAVWWIALGRVGERLGLSQLALLALAQQFVNQTIPSAGLSGLTAIAGFMRGRGVSEEAVALAFGAHLVGSYLAHLLVLAVALVILWLHHSLSAALLSLALIFSLVMVGLLLAFGYGWRAARRRGLPAWLARFRPIAAFFEAIEGLPRGVLGERGIVLPAILLLGSIFLFDAATLWVVLRALGISLDFAHVFAAHVVASAAALLLLVPGGLGVFEGGLTLMLGLFGVPVAPALAGAILLRGFTYWLPLIPGYLAMRHEMRAP